MATYSFNTKILESGNTQKAVREMINHFRPMTVFSEKVSSATSIRELVSAREALSSSSMIKEPFSYSLDEAEGTFVFRDGEKGKPVTVKREEGEKEKDFYRRIRSELMRSFNEGIQSMAVYTKPGLKQRELLGPLAEYGRAVLGISSPARKRRFNIFRMVILASLMQYIIPAALALGLVRNIFDRVKISRLNRGVSALDEATKAILDEVESLKSERKEKEEEREQDKAEEQNQAEAQDKAEAQDSTEERDASRDGYENSVAEQDAVETREEEKKYSYAERSDEEISRLRHIQAERMRKDAEKREAAGSRGKDAPGRKAAPSGRETETARTSQEEARRELDRIFGEIVMLTHIVSEKRSSLGLRDDGSLKGTKKIAEGIINDLFAGKITPESARMQLKEVQSGLLSEKNSLELGPLEAGSLDLLSPEERVQETLSEIKETLKEAAARPDPVSLQPVQNVNGGLYMGASQLILNADMANKGHVIPVYLTREQIEKAGLQVSGNGCPVLHVEDGNVRKQTVFNIEETDFIMQFPDVYKGIEENMLKRRDAAERKAAKKEAKDIIGDKVPHSPASLLTARALLGFGPEAEAAKRQSGKANGFEKEMSLGGTYQDLVRWLTERGGLSVSEYASISSDITKTMVNAIKAGYSKAFGVDFNNEIASAVKKSEAKLEAESKATSEERSI